MGLSDKTQKVIAAIGLLSPIIIAGAISMAHADQYGMILKNAFGNGGLLSPLAIIIIGLLIKKHLDWRWEVAFLFCALSLLLLIYHGTVLERMVYGYNLRLRWILANMAAYILFALYDVYNSGDIEWSENS